MAKDTQLLKGILEGCVLVIFKKGENYGYRVVEQLQACGFKNIKEASVYPLLNRLEKKDYLVLRRKQQVTDHLESTTTLQKKVKNF